MEEGSGARKSASFYSSFKQRLFQRDCSRFRTYIESTTAHGVVHIFIGKSYLRRIFWLAIVLGCATGCLYNCIDRIRFLASKPTTTTITLDRRQEIIFPAVTICNLNMLQRDFLESLGLYEIVQQVLIEAEDSFDTCNHDLSNIWNLPNITYDELFDNGKHRLEDFIVSAAYLGKNISVDSSNFVPTLTRLGICYTFNSGFNGRPVRRTSGTGARLGLRLLIDVNQSQYAATPNFDAGVKIAIHRQSEPPEPDDKGVGVPTGTNAFIHVKQLNVIDKTGRSCNTDDKVSGLNFLREDFNYSSAACANDCFYTQIAHHCRCILSEEYPVDEEGFKNLRPCTIHDMCCVLGQQTTAISCQCLPSCNATSYELASSYSTFPAKSVAQRYFEKNNIDADYLTANVYFESLSISEQETSFSYNIVSLLSDIGGQLGLFMGISIISLFEFIFWLLDETKDRCFGVSERKIKRLLCREKEEEGEDNLVNSDSMLTNTSHYGMIKQ